MTIPRRRGRYICEIGGSLAVGRPGDHVHCAGCGQAVVLERREHDSEVVLPAHYYPTRAERAAMRREARS